MSAYTHEIVVSIISGLGLWFVRRISQYMKELSEDFHELKGLPDKLERLTIQFTEQIAETKETQTQQGKQIQFLIEKLIEQGPHKEQDSHKE